MENFTKCKYSLLELKDIHVTDYARKLNSNQNDIILQIIKVSFFVLNECLYIDNSFCSFHNNELCM